MFVCSFESCDYKAPKVSVLARHKDIHNTNEMYNCDACEYKGKGKHNLKVHMKKHKEPSLSCTDCKYKTYDSANFSVHKRVKHGNIILNCEVCEFTSKSKRSLRMHKEKHIKQSTA